MPDQTDGKRKKCTTTELWSRSPEKETYVRRPQKSDGDLCGTFCTDGNHHLPGVYASGFLLALLYFVYDIFSQKDYEYILENGQLTIDVIYGKNTGKQLMC